MIIRINQTPVEFTLEHEQTLSDLVASLQAWAATEGLALRGLLVDAKAVALDDDRHLDTIGELDVEAIPQAASEEAQVEVLAQYFTLVAEAAQHENSSLLQDLAAEFPVIKTALASLLAPLGGRLIAARSVLEGAWQGPALAEAAARVAQEATVRRRELQNPEAALNETLSALVAQTSTLSDLSTLFQRGQDQEAFALILDLFTLLQDADRRAALAVGSTPGALSAWNAFHAELQPFLTETEAALQAADYILLTDLLEYEVLPRLKDVQAAFPNLSKLDPVNDLL